jgi:hypothetical protein
MVQLSNKVKVGEETRVGGSSAHAKGRYVFQFQEGVDFRVGEKEQGNSYTYFFPMKSVDVAGGDPEGVGGNLNEWVNVMYHGTEINKGGFDLFSALMIHCGLLKPETDVDITSQQFADMLKLKLPDKLVGIDVGHKQEKVTKAKDDDGNLVDLPEADQYNVTRAFIMKVFPVGGGASATNDAPVPADTDW